MMLGPSQLPSNWKSPRQHKATKIHDWRNYVSEELKAEWSTFTLKQRRMIAANLNAIADQEEWD